MDLTIIFIVSLLILKISSSPVEYGNAVKSIGNFPYVVHLKIAKADIQTKQISTDGCGGALLKPGIVITAGHCLSKKHFIISYVEVTAGSIYRGDEDDEIEKRLAKGFRIHKKFDRKQKTLICDIAVVWMRRPFPVNDNPNIALAKFLDRDVTPGVVGDFAGWGQLETGYPAKGLRQVQLKRISDSDCKKKYGYAIYPNTFCVISVDLKRGISFGDSGGPFIYQGLFVGIVSYGKIKTVEEKRRKLACDATKPVILTDIRKYIEWIEKNLKVGPPENVCLKNEQKSCAL